MTFKFFGFLRISELYLNILLRVATGVNGPLDGLSLVIISGFTGFIISFRDMTHMTVVAQLRFLTCETIT
jgi:hypothetical protein